ncbi:MAG: TrkA C-terminal domain-containing protein [Candidatus Syntropharchaeia archaeon]
MKRKNRTIIPKGNTKIFPGDEITILTPRDKIDRIKRVFEGQD